MKGTVTHSESVEAPAEKQGTGKKGSEWVKLRVPPVTGKRLED